MSDVMTVDDMMAQVGRDLGWSEWFTIDQDRVDRFADVTLDHQYIHVDPERAAATPFSGTIAHGFLMMSLMVYLAEEVTLSPANSVMGINYGFDKLRFLSPVPVGSRIRFGAKVADVTDRGGGQVLVKYDVTVAIEGSDKPALVAEWLAMVVIV